MPRTARTIKVELDTIWEMPDEMWERLEPYLAHLYPPAPTGRPRIDFREALNGIIFRLRTGCQWNRLPKIFGDDSSVHRWLQRWVGDGVFEVLWAIMIEECEALDGVDWEQQAADGCLGKSRLDGEKRGETRRIEASKGPRKALSSRATVVRSA